jgi:hypothetical protein
MELAPEFRLPSPPILWPSGLPEEERAAARSLQDHLYSLSNCSDDLAAAVALFELSVANVSHVEPLEWQWNVYSRWQWLAAREGAMMLRNYKEALKLIRKLIGKCPTWLGQIDVKAIKAANSEFEAKFPRVEKLRHSVAHPELYADRDANMAYTGEVRASDGATVITGGGSFVLRETFTNRTFSSTIDGILVQYDLNADTALALVNCTKRVFDAFGPIDGTKQFGF